MKVRMHFCSENTDGGEEILTADGVEEEAQIDIRCGLDAGRAPREEEHGMQRYR